MKHWILVALVCGGSAQIGAGCALYTDRGDSGGRFAHDQDRDGIQDLADNCPNFANPDQEDNDQDGIGTLCDAGYVDVKWTLVSGDENRAVACPAEGLTIEIVAVNERGRKFLDYFWCDDESGFTEDLPAGDYDVSINLIDDEDTLLAQSGVQPAEVTSTASEPVALDFEFSLDRGSFGFSWTVIEGGMAYNCEYSSGDTVKAQSTHIDSGKTITDPFPCVDSKAITPALQLGAYKLVLSLHENDVELDATGEVEGNLEFGNHFHNLGKFMFEIQ